MTGKKKGCLSEDESLDYDCFSSLMDGLSGATRVGLSIEVGRTGSVFLLFILDFLSIVA